MRGRGGQKWSKTCPRDYWMTSHKIWKFFSYNDFMAWWLCHWSHVLRVDGLDQSCVLEMNPRHDVWSVKKSELKIFWLKVWIFFTKKIFLKWIQAYKTSKKKLSLSFHPIKFVPIRIVTKNIEGALPMWIRVKECCRNLLKNWLVKRNPWNLTNSWGHFD